MSSGKSASWPGVRAANRFALALADADGIRAPPVEVLASGPWSENTMTTASGSLSTMRPTVVDRSVSTQVVWAPTAATSAGSPDPRPRPSFAWLTGRDGRYWSSKMHF